MTFGSLFAGIGGFDLGLERAGMKCKWQVEIDPFCQRVLAKHWPDVRRWDDVRTFPPGDADEWRVEVIAGGFPCQDISFAGRGGGLDGERSGLWFEYERVIRALRPRYVLVENVAAILDPGRGFDRVLSGLASLGFDAEWSVLSACAMGAPHTRERVFVVAHANRLDGKEGLGPFEKRGPEAIQPGDLGESRRRRLDAIADAGRSLDGIPDRVDRLRSLGNSIYPEAAEWIGRQLMEASHDERRGHA